VPSKSEIVSLEVPGLMIFETKMVAV